MKNPLILIVLLLSSTVMAEDWSAQLQSPIPAQRDRAEKQLIEMGPNSGVVLPDANQAGLPADVKRRIDRIRRAWDERSAAAFLEPSSVDNLPTSSLRAWLEAAEKKTGNPIDFKRLDDQLLDAPIESPKSTQFWKAMDELALRYGLNYSWFERPKAVRLTPQSGNREWGIGNSNSPAVNLNPTAYCLLPTASYPGAFRFEMQEWGTTVRLADPSSSTVRTGLILAWEPRLRPIYIDVRPQMTYADGTVKTGESIQILAGEGAAKPIDFIFPLTSESGKKTETLSGDLSVVIAGEQKTFAFPIPSDGKPQSLRQDQAVVVLKSFSIEKMQATNGSGDWQTRGSADGERRLAASQLATNIAVEFDESYNGLRSYMTWLNYNKAFVVDSDGKRYESSNWETVWQSDRGAEAKYYFTVPSGVKIRQIEYLTPTAIRRIDYSFKFEEKFSEKF